MDKFIAEIDRMIIKPRKKILNHLPGNRKSKGKGNSFDFYGHRNYFAGDDYKKIDWKAYVKTNELYIREYSDERQMNINIIIDSSMSMSYGNPNKFELCRIITLGLCYISLKQNDKLNVFALNDEIISIKNNIASKNMFYSLTKDINEITPSGRANIDLLIKNSKLRNGLTILISDFFDVDFNKLLKFLYDKGHDAIIIQLLSPQEISPILTGDCKIVDSETGEDLMININSEHLEKYKERLENIINHNKSMCSSLDYRFFLVSSNENPVQVISRITEV